MKELKITLQDDIPFPTNFNEMTTVEKTDWLNSVCESIIKKYFFDNGNDLMETLREIVTNTEHPETYWISKLQDDGRVKCHKNLRKCL